jgi:hypothetical protein
MIQALDTSFVEEEVHCNGVDPSIVSYRNCEIPIDVLRANPYNLDYPDLVVAKVKSRNINGWSDFSDTNTVGAQIKTEPATMTIPRRGALTSQFQIHIEWDALTGDDLKGSIVTSYYLQWDKGTSQNEWFDLVGASEAYLSLEYIANNVDLT